MFMTLNTPVSHDPSRISEASSSTIPTTTTLSALDTDIGPAATTKTLSNASKDVGKIFPKPTPPRTYHSTSYFGFSAFDLTPSRSDPSFEGEANQEEEEENDTRDRKKEKEREDNYVFDDENERLELSSVFSTTTENTRSVKKDTRTTDIQGNIKKKEMYFTEGANEAEVVERSLTEDSIRDGNNVMVYKDLHAMDVILQLTKDFVQGALGATRSRKDALHMAEKEIGVTPQPEEKAPKQETFFTQERNSIIKSVEGKRRQLIDNGWEFVDVNITRSEETTKEQQRNIGASRRRRRKQKKGRRKHIRRHEEIRRERKKKLEILKFIRNKRSGPSQTHVFLPTTKHLPVKHGDMAISLRTTEIPTQPSLPSPVISDLPKLHRRRVHRKGREQQKFPSAQLQSPKIPNRSSETDVPTPEKDRRVTNYKISRKDVKISELPQRRLAEENRIPEMKVRNEHRIITEFLRREKEQLALPFYGRTTGE